MQKTLKTKHGLVAMYQIWPGNGSSLFLQPKTRQVARVNNKVKGGTEKAWLANTIPKFITTTPT